MLFAVMAGLEGDAEIAARIAVVGTTDVDAGVREEATLWKCLCFRGFLRIFAVIREGEKARRPIFVKPRLMGRVTYSRCSNVSGKRLWM